MLDVRLRKLWRDLRSEPGRVGLMVTAIAVSLIAVGSVLGAYAILTREIAVNYLGTKPASATLEFAAVSPELVRAAGQDPQVSAAEGREVVLSRAKVGPDWRPLLLFVIDDFSALRVNTFRSQDGAWPPPTGSLLLERSARGILAATTGERLLVKSPNGKATPLLVSGLVHDPGLAPAWQEREGYGYITRATLAALGEAPVLGELRVRLRDIHDTKGAEVSALALAERLERRGFPAREIRVPPLDQHPHQRQMTTILFLLLTFSLLSLLLSAIVVATSLAALLARQVREIGVMKTVGATTRQIAAMYLLLVAGLGACSVLIALPAGIAGARAFAGEVAEMLNFTLTSRALPAWVFVVQAAAGVVLPLLVAAVPIGRATRASVRQAIEQYGASADTARPGYARLPPALRNALRRPGRLALTLTLLAAGGAMFMTALNVSRGWQRNLDKIYETRKYDVEVRLHAPASAELAETLRSLPEVRSVEAWGYSPAAFARPEQLPVLRTYPDRGHGSLSVLAPPAHTGLIRLPVRAGRWLEPADTDAVVLNHVAFAQANAAGVGVGERVWLSLDGQRSNWRVVGVVEEIGSAGVAYVTDSAFSRVMGTRGRARMLRIVTRAQTAPERQAAIRSIDDASAAAEVELVTPLSELRTAVGDHVVILMRALLAMAVVMAIVGALGLGSTLGTSVVERTRELGVMKALGATPARISRLIVAEAAFITALSFVFALTASVPLTFAVDWLVGNLGFLAPLPLVIGVSPAFVWLVLSAVVGLSASWLPARRAAALSVREALSCN